MIPLRCSPSPTLTLVPNAKRWLVGVANVRGDLLPVIDFSSFLLAKPLQPDPQARILTISHGDIRAGLMVAQVYGIRHIELAAQSKDILPTAPAPLRDMLSGRVTMQGQTFYIMAVTQLIEQTGFMQVAA